MVVGQHTTIDLRLRYAGDVLRMHAIVHALAFPMIVTLGDGGLQIDDSHIGRRAF